MPYNNKREPMGLTNNPLTISLYSKSPSGVDTLIPQPPPVGYIYLKDNDNVYLIDNDGSFLDAPL